MNYTKLNQIPKLYFGYEEIAKTLGIKLESARVQANRYVNQGVLFRIKRNLYILSTKWASIGREEGFSLANVVQVPSYVSLLSALAYYEITTLIQQNFIECISIKRTKHIEIQKMVFNYSKIQPSLYFDFVKTKNFFIATPEKAFLDAVYLMSLSKYKFDLTSIDFDKLNLSRLKVMLKKFPKKTQELLENEYFTKT